MDLIRKLAVPLVVIALVTAAVLTMVGGGDTKRLVAHFPRTVSLYEGSEVAGPRRADRHGGEGQAVRH